jgi:hypothetical protein
MLTGGIINDEGGNFPQVALPETAPVPPVDFPSSRSDDVLCSSRSVLRLATREAFSFSGPCCRVRSPRRTAHHSVDSRTKGESKGAWQRTPTSCRRTDHPRGPNHTLRLHRPPLRQRQNLSDPPNLALDFSQAPSAITPVSATLTQNKGGAPGNSLAPAVGFRLSAVGLSACHPNGLLPQ